jgi:hypothetical protein
LEGIDTVLSLGHLDCTVDANGFEFVGTELGLDAVDYCVVVSEY